MSDSCQITPTSADYLCLDAGKPDAEPIVRVRALESGVDDAVPRDVYLELFARVRVLLRRSTLGQADAAGRVWRHQL